MYTISNGTNNPMSVRNARGAYVTINRGQSATLSISDATAAMLKGWQERGAPISIVGNSDRSKSIVENFDNPKREQIAAALDPVSVDRDELADKYESLDTEVVEAPAQQEQPIAETKAAPKRKRITRVKG